MKSPMAQGTRDSGFFSKGRLAVVLVLSASFALCAAIYWVTGNAETRLSFPQGPATAQNSDGKQPLVDLSPWLTAQALAPMADSAEERRYARDAERLADHDVDQAFAAALRMAALQDENRTLTGDALALSQKAAQLQQFLQNDQAQVDRLTAKVGTTAGKAKESEAQPPEDSDLEVAKAQLALDSDELTDAQRDLERASDDRSVQIKAELDAHEATMRQYDSQVQREGDTAAVVEEQKTTMASQLREWLHQRVRARLIEKARQQIQAHTAKMAEEHGALEAKANATPATGQAGTSERAAALERIKDQRAERQVLSIYDDRIQAEQQLATVYANWSAQVALQHGAISHKMLLSVALILLIVLCMVLSDTVVRHFLGHPDADRGQLHTLRSVLELGTQAVGLLLILLVIFGTPQQMPTIVGLATAGLTIALQDFIVAFLGWFVLMGKNGIRVGDWVEINGVGGEVTSIGLFYTTLLETGSLTEKGRPTGRRIRLINSFAIRGQYFNFSTAGQWMWDEITVNVPASGDADAMVEGIRKVVQEETSASAAEAEKEWETGVPGGGLSLYSTKPSVNMQPSGTGIDVQVRYVTRASRKFEVRNRLYQHILDLMREKNPSASQPAMVDSQK